MKRSGWMLMALVVLFVGGLFASRVFRHSDQHQSGALGINPKDGADMVWVPAGEFLMGSTDEQTTAVLKKEWPKSLVTFIKFLYAPENPQHKVYLDGYWMYKYPVTVVQYRKFCYETIRDMPDRWPEWGWRDDHPMVNVRWQDAVDYAKWAEVSLPTEAQWEKAARGTDGRIYPWGNEWDASKCANSVETKLKSTQPVGSHTSGASPYGCMDMAGNVWEWCADWCDPNYYKRAPARNPKGPSEAVEFTAPMLGKVTGDRVLRGGSWDFAHIDHFRCANRDHRGPMLRSHNDGFRCAKTP